MRDSDISVGERADTRIMVYQETEDAQSCLSLAGSLIECELDEFILRETTPLFMLSTETSGPVVDAPRYGPLPLSNQRMIAWSILPPNMVVPHPAASNDIATINGCRSFCR